MFVADALTSVEHLLKVNAAIAVVGFRLTSELDPRVHVGIESEVKLKDKVTVLLLGYKEWARILTIILSCLHILNIPFGTALGVYGLWVLFSPESVAIFERRARLVA